jgi:hypothetical protein
MQVRARPGFSSQATVGFFAQLPQPFPRAACTVMVLGEIRQVFAYEGIHTRIPLRGMMSDGLKNVVVNAQRYILHLHSICATVQYDNTRL